MTKEPKPNEALLAEIGLAPYVSLQTYRRDGSAVSVPVWHVEMDSRFYVFTEKEAYKVKRLRRDPRAALAVCDWKGLNVGEYVSVTGRILGANPESREADRVLKRRMYAALIEKYGWQMRLGNLMSWASGRIQGRGELEFSPSA